MKENQIDSHTNFDKDFIDIKDIIKNIWRGKKLIIKTTISFFIIGCIVSVLSPVIYMSQTTFVPQVSDDQMKTSSNGIGSLASLTGINLNTEFKSDSYLSPLLYSKIIDSEEFSLKLLSEQLINSNAKKFTVKEYLLSNERSFNFNPIVLIKKYTIGLFSKNKANKVKNDFLKNYNFISEEDYSLINSFRNKFTIELNEKEGFIKVLATDKNAFISTQLVELITKSLQSKIIDIRTNKIRERLEYSNEQYELKQFEFDSLQKKLAEFKDSNKNISTASFMSELQKLQSEHQLQQNILLNLASEYNNNKIKLNKNTPIFSVIDEVSVPNERSKPNRSLIIIIYVFLGLIISVSYLILSEPLTNLINDIIKSDHK